MDNSTLKKEPSSYRPTIEDQNYANRLKQKQEVSFARRLWCIQILYENTLNGTYSGADELSQKLNLTNEEVRIECNILQLLGLITVGHYSDDGNPYDISLTGTVIHKIENAPIMHYDLLENDVKALQLHDANIELKKLEIESLKQETALKKMEVWINVTSSIQEASKWFSVLFGASG